MKKRRLLLGVGVLAVLGMAGMVVWESQPRPGITRANYERIREGMTLVEVEAILGRPGDGFGGDGDTPRVRFWQGDHVKVTVWFDTDGCVEAGWCGTGEEEWEPLTEDEGFLDRLRRLLPW